MVAEEPVAMSGRFASAPEQRGSVDRAAQAPLPGHTSRPLRMHPRRTGMKTLNQKIGK